MIEINLLPGPRRKKKKRGGGGPSFSLPDFGEIVSRINDPIMLGLIGAWVVSIGAMVVIFLTYNGMVAELTPQRDRLLREKNRYQRELTLARQATSLLDSLDAELEAIRQIDSDRYVWPHVMDELARALPQFTWLRSVDLVNTLPSGGIDAPVDEQDFPTISIEGTTSEMNLATSFVRRLQDSPWFTDVNLGSAASGIEQDRSVFNFSVEATFQMADSSAIRTVPVTGIIE